MAKECDNGGAGVGAEMLAEVKIWGGTLGCLTDIIAKLIFVQDMYYS